MRLNIRELLISRSVCIDHTQLVVIAAGTGKDEPSDMFLGRHRAGRVRRYWSGRGLIGLICACEVDRIVWDQNTKGYRNDHQDQTDRQAKAPRGSLTTGKDVSFIIHGSRLLILHQSEARPCG